jgi:hypothetical protein
MKTQLVSAGLLAAMALGAASASAHSHGPPPSHGASGEAIAEAVARRNILNMELANQAQARAAKLSAERYLASLTPAKKAELKKKIRYLAVPTVRSTSTPSNAKEVVMIWDIPRETLANQNVYAEDTALPAGTLATFDNLQAEYISTPRTP